MKMVICGILVCVIANVIRPLTLINFKINFKVTSVFPESNKYYSQRFYDERLYKL